MWAKVGAVQLSVIERCEAASVAVRFWGGRVIAMAVGTSSSAPPPPNCWPPPPNCWPPPPNCWPPPPNCWPPPPNCWPPPPNCWPPPSRVEPTPVAAICLKSVFSQSLNPVKLSLVFPSKLMSWPLAKENKPAKPVTRDICASLAIGRPSQYDFAGLPIGLPLPSKATGHETYQLVFRNWAPLKGP